MVKAANRSKKTKDTSKNPAQWAEYLNTISLQMFPANDQYFQRFALEWVTWTRENKNSYCMEDFFDFKGVHDSDVYDWMAKHEVVDQAHGIVKRILANRRETDGLTRKIDSALVSRSMPLYSKKWKELEEWRSKLKEKEAQSAGNLTVVMEDFSKKE